MNTLAIQKRKPACPQPSLAKAAKAKPVDRKLSSISMSEVRQIAEHVFSGMAWSG